MTAVLIRQRIFEQNRYLFHLVGREPGSVEPLFQFFTQQIMKERGVSEVNRAYIHQFFAKMDNLKCTVINTGYEKFVYC